MAAGEGAKCGQYGQAGLADEARQAQPVTRRPAEPAHGVQVPSQHEVRGVRLGMVAGREGAE